MRKYSINQVQVSNICMGPVYEGLATAAVVVEMKLHSHYRTYLQNYPTKIETNESWAPIGYTFWDSATPPL